MVKIALTPVYGQIQNLEKLEIIDTISKALSYVEPGHKFQFKYKSGGWNGRTRLLSKSLKFPSGLLTKVCDILKSFGIEFTVEDRIQYPARLSGLQYEGPPLYPHQRKIVESALSSKRGMIKSPTGSGKTYSIAAVVGAINRPTMVYVVSLELLTQMRDTISDALGVEVGVVGGGQFNLQPITVCSVWTAGAACGADIKKLDEDADKWTPNEKQKRELADAIRGAEVLVLDEAQFAAAQSIRVILKESQSAVYRFGFTATPWRTGGDDILLEAAFGPKICDISASELIEQGYLAQPKIIFRDIPKHTSTIAKDWSSVKYTYINHNPIRNAILVSNTVKLLEMGRKPLMLFRELNHGELLAEGFTSDVRVALVSGKMKASEREQIKLDYRAGKIDVLIASTIYDQGVDIKELDALVPCGGGRSTAKALQRIGRVIRTNPAAHKKDAYIIETFDQTHFMKEHSLLRYEIYKSEPAFLVKTGADMAKFLAKKGK